MHERYQIQAPENITFGYQIADMGPRLMAALIDHGILLAVGIGGGLLAAQWARWPWGARWLLPLLGLLLFFGQWGYFMLFEIGWNGQSPGKRMLRLRVIRLDGSPVRLEESALRNLLRPIDYLPANYLLGWLALVSTDRMQRVGDYVAGTLVVREGDFVPWSAVLHDLDSL